MPKTCNYASCRNPVFGGGFCRVHQFIRTDRKTKEKEIKKSRPRINSASKKQTLLNKEYSTLRKDFLEKHPLCVANFPEICTKLATDVHHKKGRGIFFLIQETWISLCRSCHERVENNPKEAKELGLSDSRLN